MHRFWLSFLYTAPLHSLPFLPHQLEEEMSTFTFRQGDLPKLDLQVDRGTDFAAWKAQWDCYSSLSGLTDQSDER